LFKVADFGVVTD